MWNYIRQLNAFDEMSRGKLSPVEASLYMRLFFCCNRLEKRGDWFDITNRKLMMESGIGSWMTLSAARDSLKESGLIDFEAGDRRSPPRYILPQLYQEQNDPKPFGSKNEPKTESKSPFDSKTESKTEPKIPFDSENEPKTEPKGGQDNLYIISNINNKEYKRESVGTTPPTLSEISEYIRERGLAVDAAGFLAYYEAGGWRDSKGQPVKNWKQKILTWDKYDRGKQNAAGKGNAGGNALPAQKKRYDPERERAKWAAETSGWD